MERMTGIYEERLKKDRAKQEERVEFLMRKYFYIWLNKVRYSCRIDAAHTSLWNIQDELRRDAVLMCNFCDQSNLYNLKPPKDLL